eukprot:CAMPEP_0184512530 /NCGR_PEP_ID=MMETSP0198_2-20121128/2928_1 /TAXON_ID=1112570 /ORGANISM="Thraustochytrium sp., Strain LLF1b" /LENGTH=223 /DNA_ID=CAMNT_0026902557 /DNA_START=111 /DNA_END=782 /DNA_ORIENTATION=-
MSLTSSLLSRTRTIVCIGRNYAAHASELSNAVPSEPFYFLKPISALVTPESDCQEIVLPHGVGEVHHEGELAVVIGSTAHKVSKAAAMSVVAGLAASVDVTGRELQNKAKEKRLPWTRAKGYTTWCPVGHVTSIDEVTNLEKLQVCLSVNGEERQRSEVANMIFDIPTLIHEVTKVMVLSPGDLILTGTPAGVAKLEPGDRVKCWIEGLSAPPLEVEVVSDEE